MLSLREGSDLIGRLQPTASSSYNGLTTIRINSGSCSLLIEMLPHPKTASFPHNINTLWSEPEVSTSYE